MNASWTFEKILNPDLFLNLSETLYSLLSSTVSLSTKIYKPSIVFNSSTYFSNASVNSGVSSPNSFTAKNFNLDFADKPIVFNAFDS